MKPADVLLAISVAVIWGMGFTFAKAAIEDFPPILLMALRFSLTALALVWFVRPPWQLLGKIFWIALVSAAIQYSLTFTGLQGVGDHVDENELEERRKGRKPGHFRCRSSLRECG